VVARVCLDTLRSRSSRREESLDAQLSEPVAKSGSRTDPEQEALLADSVGIALLVVLERLSPAERLAFVLHDMFALSFDEIAAIVGRSPEAARQLASRARRRVQGADTVANVERTQQREVVNAFLSALRAGDVEGLVAVLDPDVVFRGDAGGARPGAPIEVRGARKWARGAIAFSQFAQFAQPALIDGAVGLVMASGGRLSRVLRFTIVDGKVTQAEAIGDPARLRQLNLAVLAD
jgi:RNA polymerase sigma-70 factor (ECF subfamily)